VPCALKELSCPLGHILRCDYVCASCMQLQASDSRFSTLTSDFDAAMGPLFALLVDRV
jgi:hypothetical protein